MREEMARMRGQYEQQVALLQGKLHWYAENQQLLTDSEALAREQAATIAELRAEAARGGKAGAVARKEVADLQEQVRVHKPAHCYLILCFCANSDPQSTLSLRPCLQV